ncbi:WD40 repeat domain-containing protein [Anaerolinea sp.]|uniref:WD40 repeat domain-containing protein n=1 Tax=Anaerolinea sp. TaxID=1872519 RepID=UPI002ACE740E|nr:WD40 repeat domain-containing protein [Anaerolinea sp.]
MRFVLVPLILLFAAVLGFLALRLSAASGAVPSETTSLATETPTAIPSPTATQTPTATVEPTATATPTPTPITLPVTNGTPIPDLPYEVITAENVQRLRQIARYGYPRLLDANPYRLTADGKTLVVGTTLGLEFYDAATQTKTGGFEAEFLRSFDLTPDGQYLLTLAGETLTVWTRDGQKVREFNLQAGDAWQLNAAALSPDGSMLAVQRKKTDWQEADKVDVYRVQDGRLLDTVRGNGVLFSPDGQYLATVFDGSVRLYPAAELGQGWEKRLPKSTLPWCSGPNERCGLVFSPDGTLAAVVRAARVDVYQVETRRLVRQVSGWESEDYSLPQVQFADGQMLIATPAVYDRQGNVRVEAQVIAVDVASGEWLSRSDVEDGFAYLDAGQVRMFRWDQDNNKTFRILGIRDNGELALENKKCQVIDNDFTCYTLSKDRTNWRLVSEQGKTVLQFKSLGEDSIKAWIFPEYIVINHVWNGETRIGKLRIYNSYGEMILETSGLVYFANATKSGVVAVLVFGEAQSEIVILKPKGKMRFLRFPFSEALMIGISDDMLVTFGYSEIVFWDLDRLFPIKRLSNGDMPTDVKAWVQLSPNEEMFLFSIGSLQNAIGVVDLRSEKPSIMYLMQEISVAGRPSFSPDGRLLATNGDDGFIRIWAVVPAGADVR